MSQRIKGQEVELIIVLNNQPLFNITTIKDFEFTFQLEVLAEGYLGETTNRRDSVFKGIEGKMMVHLENQGIFLLQDALVNKARRRTAGTQVVIKGTMNFPNGDRPLIIIPDAEFGDLPFNFASRTDYVSTTLNFGAAQANTVLS